MSNPQPRSLFATFAVDSAELPRQAVSAVRTMLGIVGAISLVIGVLITFWPERTAQVATILLAVYFLIAGIAYAAIGIFSKSVSGGARALNIVLGALFIAGAIIAFANINATAAVLAIFIGIIVGIVWILEGVLTLAQIGDASSKGWAIFFGILSLIAGIAVLAAPLWAATFLFILVGISLIVLGIIQIVRAITFGRSKTA